MEEDKIEVDMKTKELEDEGVVSEEDFEKAMAALNRSKSSRVKEINKRKKEIKKKEKEAEEAKKPVSDRQNIGDKMKKDPVIPICLILAFVTVIGAVIYFIFPNVYVPSLGLTYADLKADYFKGAVYTELLSGEITALPESSSASTIAYMPDLKYEGGQSYFTGNIEIASGGISGTVCGSRRNVDGKLTELRIMATFKDGDHLVNNYVFYCYYFASFIEHFRTDLAKDDVISFTTELMSCMKKIEADGDFTVVKDTGYRVSVMTGDSGNAIILDIIPSKGIQD